MKKLIIFVLVILLVAGFALGFENILSLGWNLVASPYDSDVSIEQGLSSIGGCYQYIFGFYNQSWKSYSPLKEHNNMHKISPYYGYWIKINCSNVTWQVIDEDGDDYPSYLDCNDSDENIYPGATELCNNIDDDCNPATADGYNESWLGDPCDGADTDLCQEGAFVCTSAVKTCTDNTGNTLEICDDVDNDCNPATADGADEAWLGTACDGADSDLCQEGAFVCSAGSKTCNDNDAEHDLDLCNGDTNDDCNPATADGYDDPLNGAVCDGIDSDLCEEGTYSCVSGLLSCSDNTGNTLDLCNGNTNDDCNPATPDGHHESWLGNPCDGADSDLCQEGNYVCELASPLCTDNTGNNLDLCNGYTNDDCNAATADGSDEAWFGSACDGLDTDLCQEGIYSCSGGSQLCTDNDAEHDLDLCNSDTNDDCNAATPDGSDEAWLGNPCDGADSDLCYEGNYVCQLGSPLCTDNTGNNLDLCNGYTTDDCNGATPDGYDESWLGDPCDGADSDLCQEGTFVCSAGSKTCTDNTGNTLEICDGLNNDCDGEVDEGCDDDGDDYCDSDMTTEGTPPVCPSGGGDCDDANVAVNPGEQEICNGMDDDCNGQTDEGNLCNLPHATSSCVSGVCQVSSCNYEYGNCDGVHSNGCEVDLDMNPSCSSYTSLSTIRGDKGSDSVTRSAHGEKWFRIYISEGDSSPSCEYLSATIRLYLATGTDYDLYVYCDNCVSEAGHSTNGGSAMEEVKIRWNEECILGIPTGSNSGRYVYILVKYWSANTCNNYNLHVYGNTAVSTNTCSEK